MVRKKATYIVRNHNGKTIFKVTPRCWNAFLAKLNQYAKSHIDFGYSKVINRHSHGGRILYYDATRMQNFIKSVKQLVPALKIDADLYIFDNTYIEMAERLLDRHSGYGVKFKHKYAVPDFDEVKTNV